MTMQDNKATSANPKANPSTGEGASFPDDSMDFSLFQIAADEPLRTALAMIDENKCGMVLVRDAEEVVVGIATDGDIRRELLQGASLDDPIFRCCNRDFVWADQGTPRESLLKQLDQMIKVLPVLDERRRLVDIVSRNRLPIPEEMQVYARSRAPVRISFGGGGSDLTHYFRTDDGAVINAAVAIYSHATLRKRGDKKIFIHSRDLDATLEADDLFSALGQPGPFGLIQAILKTLHPCFGFDLYLHSDFPMKSGLGGSAVVAAAILGCFNQFRQDKWDAHELAELAYQAERIYLGVEGGWQDQYATVFGGFNFIEFRLDQNLVHPLRLHPDIICELEESLILCDTGIVHNSGDIHEDQRAQMQKTNVQDYVRANVALSYRIRDHLLRGRLFDFGKALHETWEFKRKFSDKISSSHLDTIYNGALENGAVGGKLLGAGGGGFFLFYVLPFRRYELIDYLKAEGNTVRPFRFDSDGMRAWTVRDKYNSEGVGC